MLPIKKLYIDSKARTADSRSTTNFAIDLVDSLSMPEGAVFSICDVLVPHTWYLIDAGRNNNLYFTKLLVLIPVGLPKLDCFQSHWTPETTMVKDWQTPFKQRLAQ